MGEAVDRKRLHITPFSKELLDRFVSPSLQSQAIGISFHAVQTFPERGFGYVELPAMEADKLKKKLNGSLLKGTKIKIEDAKPEKKRKIAAKEEVDQKQARKKAKKEKKRKEQGVLEGHELEEGRHIKRGWTEGKDEKKSKKRKAEREDGIEGKKMKFKTTMPPNVVPVEKGKAASKSKEKKEQKGPKSKRTAVVQEGKKAQKLPASGMGVKGKAAATFEEGKGWLDEYGNVVEAEPVSKRPKRAKSADKQRPVEQPEPVVDSAVEAANESSSEDSSVLSESSAISSDEESDHGLPVAPAVETARLTTPDMVNDSANTLARANEVHPLEALFKRPTPNPGSASKPKPLPIDTSFTFFNSGAADEDLEAEDHVPGLPPQTPHTKQDMEWRSVRSAAPTPDTAAIGRKFSFPFARGNSHDDEDVDMDAQGVEDEAQEGDADAGAALEGASQGEKKEESEFRKWFYDHRGDLNRGWKKRRREERKSKRQRENRRLSRRVV